MAETPLPQVAISSRGGRSGSIPASRTSRLHGVGGRPQAGRAVDQFLVGKAACPGDVPGVHYALLAEEQMSGAGVNERRAAVPGFLDVGQRAAQLRPGPCHELPALGLDRRRC